MSYNPSEQEAVLGRLLMDIVHGDLTDDTIDLVKDLDQEDLGLPVSHLVGYVKGIDMELDTLEKINKELLDELRFIIIEQAQALGRTVEKIPLWKQAPPISEQATCLLKELLLETLQGRIRLQTLEAIYEVDDLETVPEPYRDILKYAQYANENGTQIAGHLLQILRVTIDQIIKMRS